MMLQRHYCEQQKAEYTLYECIKLSHLRNKTTVLRHKLGGSISFWGTLIKTQSLSVICRIKLSFIPFSQKAHLSHNDEDSYHF